MDSNISHLLHEKGWEDLDLYLPIVSSSCADGYHHCPLAALSSQHEYHLLNYGVLLSKCYFYHLLFNASWLPASYCLGSVFVYSYLMIVNDHDFDSKLCV